MKRAAVITVSTRAAAGIYPDDAGPAVAEMLRDAGFEIADVGVIPDGRSIVASAIRSACEDVDLVVTCGGTGLSPQDETPDATADIIDRPVPGIAEAMRAASLQVTQTAMLSRAVSGVRGTTLIINLPGSPTAARENLQAVIGMLDHAVDQLRGGDHPRTT